VKTFAALSRNEKYMFNSQNKKNVILYRYPAGVVATYRPSVDKWSLSPYIGFGYALIYTYEQIGEPIEEFREERVYESFSYGYVMELGLEYHFNENVTLSFQSQLITSKVIYKEEYVNFGGYATTLGITYGF
jgi:outer membrane protein W